MPNPQPGGLAATLILAFGSQPARLGWPCQGLMLPPYSSQVHCGTRAPSQRQGEALEGDATMLLTVKPELDSFMVSSGFKFIIRQLLQLTFDSVN
jgi:hypothetical protein